MRNPVIESCATLKYTRIGITILAAGLAGTWLGLNLAAPSHATPPAAAANMPGTQSSPAAVKPAAPPADIRPAPAASRTEPAGAAMLAQFQAAPSYRAFIYRALKDPEHGGHAYSAHALSICSGANTASRDPDSDAQRAARVMLRTRCDMSDSEKAQMEDELFRALLKDPDKDPLWKATSYTQMSGSPAEQRAALAQAMTLQLPSPVLLLAAVPREEGKGPYFQGKYYDTESGRQLYLAMNLAGCSLGADCSANSAAALALCAKRGWCADDLPSALRAGRADDFEQIQALSKQIVQAIQRRDAAAFVPGV